MVFLGRKTTFEKEVRDNDKEPVCKGPFINAPWFVRENPLLKEEKYPVLKNRVNLSRKQEETPTSLEVPKLNLKTIRTLRIRENFQEIYNARSLPDFCHPTQQVVLVGDAFPLGANAQSCAYD